MKTIEPKLFEENGDITINGQLWEHWSVYQLLGIVEEFGISRHAAWQQVELASDAEAAQLATERYSSHLQAETLAYRALGFLRTILDPMPNRSPIKQGNLSKDTESSCQQRAKRAEYVLGCDLAGICPFDDEIPDPFGVIPR